MRLRSEQKCGELSARLAKAKGNQHVQSISDDTKRAGLKSAGLSRLDVYRAERLAGYSETRPSSSSFSLPRYGLCSRSLRSK